MRYFYLLLSFLFFSNITFSQNYTEQTQKLNFKMITVKGGSFKMGSNNGDKDEKPIHNVTISDFYMAEFEVTEKLWQEIMGTKPSSFIGDEKPVQNVSWDDAQNFIKKLNAKTGKKYRLPTEAEWEYAAKGGRESQGAKYAGSNYIGNVAWYRKNSYDLGKRHGNYGTNPVGGKKANELGIYDMTGNVWEWCQDKWCSDYKSTSQDGSAWEIGDGSLRVLRGGSWNDGAVYCRVAYRYYNSADDRNYGIGFRLASNL